MGWYIAAIFVWWLVSGIFDLFTSGVPGLISMMTVTAFLYVGWWLPYTSWIAFGEFHFFWKYPDKKAPFFIFAALSFVGYSLLIFLYPKWSGSWPFLVLPAAAVTVMYLARRMLRGGAIEDQRASAQGRLAKAIVLLGITGAIVTTYKYFYPTYEYRYRLTVNIDADGAPHSGSGVIDVTWYAHPFPEAVSFSSELRGQAALVDLGSHGVVVATLHNGESGAPLADATWIAPRAFNFSTLIEKLPEFMNMRGKRNLALDNLPRFIWFSNPQDPMTARKVLAQDFPTIIGPGVRFSNASVEITNDRLLIDIRQKLPWLKSLEQRPDWDQVIYLPDRLAIARNSFIGERS